jgi:hypothetical protein
MVLEPSRTPLGVDAANATSTFASKTARPQTLLELSHER